MKSAEEFAKEIACILGCSFPQLQLSAILKEVASIIAARDAEHESAAERLNEYWRVRAMLLTGDKDRLNERIAKLEAERDAAIAEREQAAVAAALRKAYAAVRITPLRCHPPEHEEFHSG